MTPMICRFPMFHFGPGGTPTVPVNARSLWDSSPTVASGTSRGRESSGPTCSCPSNGASAPKYSLRAGERVLQRSGNCGRNLARLRIARRRDDKRGKPADAERRHVRAIDCHLREDSGETVGRDEHRHECSAVAKDDVRKPTAVVDTRVAFQHRQVPAREPCWRRRDGDERAVCRFKPLRRLLEGDWLLVQTESNRAILMIAEDRVQERGAEPFATAERNTGRQKQACGYCKHRPPAPRCSPSRLLFANTLPDRREKLGCGTQIRRAFECSAKRGTQPAA